MAGGGAAGGAVLAVVMRRRCPGVASAPRRAWPALVFVPARPAAGAFDVWAPDVGQGSAILVRTAHHSLLFDAGMRYRSGGDVGERVLVPWGCGAWANGSMCW